MAITTRMIRASIETYLSHAPDESHRLARLLAAADTSADLTCRKEYRGHVTCGAVVLDAAGRVLHLHHNALNRWLLPGGHLEPSDETLPGAALREVAEETGIVATSLAPLDGFESRPFDIDVHPIPANLAKEEAAHWHFDLRYVFQVTAVPQVRLQAEEVSFFDWLDPESVPSSEIRAKLGRVA
jgi:8-oxo-dGTP pyrophosphatase MutT (NUDIX family)